jgi:hypothetical protein
MWHAPDPTASDRSRRGLPSPHAGAPRSRRPGVNQTKPPETTLVQERRTPRRLFCLPCLRLLHALLSLWLLFLLQRLQRGDHPALLIKDSGRGHILLVLLRSLRDP